MLALLLALTACSASSIIDDPSSVKWLGEEPVKPVVIWHTYSDEETLVFEKEVVPQFEAEHPGIRIESVRQTHSQEYHAALLARASAGKSPDVIRMDYTWVPLFADRNLLYPLDRFSEFGDIAGQLQSRMLQTNEYNGRTYGLPLNITTKAAIYNTTLLKKLGLSEPPDTFAELAALAQENHLILGMAGIELWGSLPYFMALGGRLANDSFTQVTGYLDSPASVAAMERLLQLYQDGVINPAMLGGNIDLWRDIYSSSRVIMIDEGPWYYSILLNSSGVDVDLLSRTKPVPFPSGGVAGSIIGGESLVMTREAQNKEEAWTFISWMMKRETQLMLFKAGLIPVNKEAFEAGRSIADGAGRYLGAYMEGIERSFYRPSLPEWNEIEKLYDAAMEDIFMRGSDIAETLRKTAAGMDALLASP